MTLSLARACCCEGVPCPCHNIYGYPLTRTVSWTGTVTLSVASCSCVQLVGANGGARLVSPITAGAGPWVMQDTSTFPPLTCSDFTSVVYIPGLVTPIEYIDTGINNTLCDVISTGVLPQKFAHCSLQWPATLSDFYVVTISVGPWNITFTATQPGCAISPFGLPVVTLDPLTAPETAACFVYLNLICGMSVVPGSVSMT